VWWWYISVILAIRKLRQEDEESEAGLGYIERPHLKTKQNNEVEALLSYLKGQ
jgi:hypothetical protein